MKSPKQFLTMVQDSSKKSDRPASLSRRQLAFIHHKILYGMNDKEAALAAGYALSVAQNTLQKIWAKPGVRAEFERLKSRFQASGALHSTTAAESTSNLREVGEPPVYHS